MKQLRAAIFIVLAGILLAGCATTPPPVEKVEQKVAVTAPLPPPVVKAPPAKPSFEDRDLFSAGLSLLTRAEGPEQAEARSIFVSLLQRYPQSPWRPAAETLIRLIDEGQALREAYRREQLLSEQGRAERAMILQENERVKRTVRELTEKLQAEKAILSQENEQLRKDIKRLRELEIEIEKRDRMLR
ncbi:MAG: hypothetical protein KJ936_13305 [Proteobacteria bacterium]|nr:hypothetical protein [Pseudomonadota bacterium]MBU2228618.1 hypothetical protein [Pseudomonadota bacterium]MBU2261525.1 hypothetical protein [Pseudomonadota bacterium]